MQNWAGWISARCIFIIAFSAVFILVAGCHRETVSSTPTPSVALPPSVVDPQKANSSRSVTAHPMHFADVSAAVGIRWKYENGATGRYLFIEPTGGGVAFFDYNNDGGPDIFALQGGPVLGAKGDARRFSTRNALYRNNGNGTFSDVTTGSGLDHYTGYGQGVSAADYDNDGHADLYLTAYGGSHLFHNNGNGTFTDVTTRAGVADKAAELPWPLSSAWGDYDNDGYLDLFVCHYCRWSLAINKLCRDGQTPGYCRPQVYEPGHSRLYHNNGNGTFTDVTHRTGIDRLQGKSMSAVWFDYDNDGRLDICVSNDTMPNFLLHNNGDGTFKDVATLAGVALGTDGTALSGMGIGVGDYDNDSREDLFMVNFTSQPKSVFHNEGSGLFSDMSFRSNIASTNLHLLGFGMECCDYDLDGYKDLIVGNGHVLSVMGAQNDGSSYAQSQQLLHNQHNGTFSDDLRSLGDLVKPRVTRGLAVADYDNDGDLDALMVGQNEPLQLFRNEGGNQAHWITLRLEGVYCNRDAIGAKITIRTKSHTQTQHVRGGSSYCSHSDERVTFGLGSETRVESLEIRWPDGRRQQFGPQNSNVLYWVREGQRPVPDPRLH
ncbi:hypothetical protein IAD21_00523 [Abditibacteriota bacterium]|nr:hypothetical protein IAD21_00523 [Abditibacteriota bacterium]